MHLKGRGGWVYLAKTFLSGSHPFAGGGVGVLVKANNK